VLTPPAGATKLDVDVAGEDVVVVSLDEAVVASADGEHAYDEARAERAPAELRDRAVTGPMDVRIFVGDDEGPMIWDVAFTFRDAAGNDLGGGTLTAAP
jgi:hypothetical protein